MTRHDEEAEILKRYLLGRLDPETEELDNRLMLGDPSVENDLGAAEDELIDAYLRGELSAEDTERFQEHFLRSAARREKLAFAESLHRYIEGELEAEPEVRPSRESRFREALLEAKRWLSGLWEWSPSPAWSYALAGLLLVALIGGVWALTGKLRLEGRLDELTAELARLEEEAAGTLSSEIATVWLSPGLLRDLGAVERLILPPGPRLARVQLDIGVDDYASYRAALHDATGDEIWTQSKLTAAVVGDKVAITVTLPSELLPRGDYSIRVNGVSSTGELELVGRYYFRVLKE